MQRISLFQRILFPLLLVSIVAVFFTAIYMFSSSVAKIKDNGNDEVEEISHVLTMAKSLVGDHVTSSMMLLRHHTSMLGQPHIEGETSLQGRTIPKLMMGTTSVTENAKLVDNITDIENGTATIFVKDNDTFIRVTTNVMNQQQQRAIGSQLDPNGAVIEQLKAGNPFYGIVDILGSPYITGYEPITNDKQQVIGAWYVGYKVDVAALAKVIKEWHFLDTGFVAVVDYNRQIRFISERTNKQEAARILEGRAPGWHIIAKNIPDWDFVAFVAYPKKEAYLQSISQLYPMLIIGSIFSIVLLLLARRVIEKLVLMPLGGDPEKASALVRRITQGDLNDDDTDAPTGTLINNMVQMRTRLRNMVSQIQEDADRLSISSSVFSNVSDGIFITDQQGDIIEVNPAFSAITGYSRAESIQQKPETLGFAHDIEHFFSDYFKASDNPTAWRGEIWNLDKKETQYLAWLDMFPVFTEAGEFRHYVGIFADITKSKEEQKKLEHQAYHDALTKLPNRIRFTQYLEKTIAEAEPDSCFAVCYLDLDEFKPINDNHGHQAGDQLLVLLASRIKNTIHKQDMVARFGGDEFAILLTSGNNTSDYQTMLEGLMHEIEKPYFLNDDTFNISASIGYTIYPNDNNEPDILLRHADNAMYHAKTRGGEHCHLFDPQQEQLSINEHQIGQEIADAIAKNALTLHFQPQVDTENGEVVAFEGLIRWEHPTKGMLMPGNFLPQIEHKPLIADIGRWVLETTLRQLTSWNQQGHRIRVAINIAAYHLTEGKFVRELKDLLNQYPEVDGDQLCLEITESAAINDINNVTNIINRCKKLGVVFAIDDFGSGYSSLIYLRKLPVDIIKIDKSFVHDMLRNSEDLAIVTSIANLSKEFNRLVVAEGVEIKMQATRLQKLGITLTQGFAIAEAMPANEVIDWVQANSPFNFDDNNA